MKKGTKILLTMFFMILVVAICISTYWYFTNSGKQLIGGNEQKNEVKETKAEGILAKNATDAIFGTNDYPKVDASLATQPLTNAFIKNFTNSDIDVSKLDYTNTHPGYVRLINDEVDLIVVTEPSEE